MTQIAQAQASVASYAAYLAALEGASGGLGRPETILSNLSRLAGMAAVALEQAGQPVTLQSPDFDVIDPDPTDENGNPRPQPGRFDPAKNATFLAAHQANIAALNTALGAL